MIESQTKEIGGVTYKVTQFGAKKARTVMVLLAKVLGPSIARATGAKGAEATIAAAIEGAMSNLTEEDFTRLCDMFSDVTEFDLGMKQSNGQPASATPMWTPLTAVFDTHFRGRSLAMIQWLVFAVQVNFSDFLADGGALVESMGLKRAANQSPPIQ